MAIKLPFNVPKAVQAAVATLSAIGVAGTAILHAWDGFLPTDWAVGITSALAFIAAAAGFLEKAEPIIEDLT